jgi:hypothetical protein
MCWNEHVSLNTFLFSSFVLGLVLYNNLYTPYKINEIHSLAAYVFLFSIISMQLVEFFLWRNLNTEYNIQLSYIGLSLLLLQPIFALSLIKDVDLREWLVVFYVFWTLALGRLSVEKTKVGENGHLEWGFFKGYNFYLVGWVFFLLFGPIYTGLWIEVSLAIILWLFTYILYRQSIRGSIWCWFVNILLLYYACILLLVLPFCL